MCIRDRFGTVERVAMGVTMGKKQRKTGQDLREVGELLAFLREPTPPANLKDALSLLPLAKTVMSMRPKIVKNNAPCQEVVIKGDDIDLNMLPIPVSYTHLDVYKRQRLESQFLWFSRKLAFLVSSPMIKSTPPS